MAIPVVTRDYNLGSHRKLKKKIIKIYSDTSQGEAGDPGSLSCCHSDIGIPINFQQESGIVTFGSIVLQMPLEVSK